MVQVHARQRHRGLGELFRLFAARQLCAVSARQSAGGDGRRRWGRPRLQLHAVEALRLPRGLTSDQSICGVICVSTVTDLMMANTGFPAMSLSRSSEARVMLATRRVRPQNS